MLAIMVLLLRIIIISKDSPTLYLFRDVWETVSSCQQSYLTRTYKTTIGESHALARRLLRTHASLGSSPNWKPTFYLLKYAGLSEKPPTFNSQQSQVIKLHLFLGSTSWQPDLLSILQWLPKPQQHLRVFPIMVPNKAQDKLVARGEKCLVLHLVFL